MKNSTSKIGQNSTLKIVAYFILFVGLLPATSYSQGYRTINAYMDDFAKNELYVKKSLMDYSVSIVESQLYTRTQYTAERIITKLENVNTILKNNNKGFEGNTLLRDSFIRMNEKTIECLKNGSLILSDYEYQSTLSLAEIGENFNRKEIDQAEYYQELRNYEADKRIFALTYKLPLKSGKGKNILEYNASQNMLFYKMNVMDEKLNLAIAAKDKKGLSDCLNMIQVMYQETLAKTEEYKGEYQDNSLNEANIAYSRFIAAQRDKLSDLFNGYVDEYNKLQSLKNQSSETNEAVAAYNEVVKVYNMKKNIFYSVFKDVQTTKSKLYDTWLTTNSAFLKRNGKIDNIYDNYAVNDKS
ncbi:MAG: hypothetical protein ABIQ27_09515 [Flavobacterium sp.]|uniref:hypothetical protein n=1 Tax=Flavobacterium sp. TaxID=239 RepID=UPI003264AF97